MKSKELVDFDSRNGLNLQLNVGMVLFGEGIVLLSKVFAGVLKNVHYSSQIP
jgi:hypothetical protein